MALVRCSTDRYVTLEEAAERLMVPPYYLLHVLDMYGLTPAVRDSISRTVTIRSKDLKGIRWTIRSETRQQGAA